MEKEALGGDVFLGSKAVDLGLVDKLGEMHTVLSKEFPGVKVSKTHLAGKGQCKCGAGTLAFAAALQDKEVLTAALEDYEETVISDRMNSRLPLFN